MPISVPGAPPDVADALNRLATELAEQAGDNLAGLVLYGGLARGRFRPGRSDVNVVVLLKRADGADIRRIAPALAAARRAAAIDAMLMTPAEVGLAALDFPTKFLDIRRHHRVLHGENPFATLAVPREVVLRRVAQSLRNMLLRQRHRYAVVCDEPDNLRRALADIARPLAIELSALLHIEGHALPAEDRTALLYEEAARELALDAPTLAALATLREDADVGDPAALVERVLALIAGLADRVDRLAAETV